jgi:predicted nucleic acid-binding Zn ribbon protein
MSEIFATHTDGRTLYYPEFDGKGEVINNGLPTVAVSICTKAGKTYPEGSIWIRGERTWSIKPGWRLIREPHSRPVETIPQAESTDVARAVKPKLAELDAVQTQPTPTKRATPRTRRTCAVCGVSFLSGRSDARHCSSKCRNKVSYRRGNRGKALRSH